ncbi:MAG TPA: HAMP domain-containing sensor histidine kinase [Thermoanaerobaculia bacterium]|nr:HAMP domain-containing sensor histidine kinase [Thermoanaerobaculia bacterium]
MTDGERRAPGDAAEAHAQGDPRSTREGAGAGSGGGDAGTEGAAPGAGSFYRELSIPLLAHELKGPLAVIEAGIRLLLEREGGESDARRERTLRRVLRSAMRAQALVEDLLEVGRAEAGRLERGAFRPAAAVAAAVAEAVEAMDAELAERIAGKSGDDLIAELARGGVALALSDRARAVVLDQDERRFQLVAANLLRNALRFRRRTITVALDVEGESLRLVVDDDGPGVAAQDRDRVFERWATGAQAETGGGRGHGLGLAAARILARGMGGEVTLAGEQGSRFVFTVPLGGDSAS